MKRSEGVPCGLLTRRRFGKVATAIRLLTAGGYPLRLRIMTRLALPKVFSKRSPFAVEGFVVAKQSTAWTAYTLQCVELNSESIKRDTLN